MDYKGLSNTGTWFIGRLQTERDKARVLDGLEGAAATTGMRFDRQGMEQTLAGLSNRIFLMNNVHDDAPAVFETRWAMSYLRGPLTRNQIKQLMDPQKVARTTSQTGKTTPGVSIATIPSTAGIRAKKSERPLLPPDIQQYFVPIRGSQPASHELTYQPVILGISKIHFSDVKSGVDISRDAAYQTTISDDPMPVNWDNATEFTASIADLEKSPLETAKFAELPSVAGRAKSYYVWGKDFAAWLYRTQRLELFKSVSLKETSNPGESERDFRIRMGQNAREKRDQATERLRQKYATKIASLEEQIRRARQAVEREEEQAKQQKMQTAISVGATLLSAFVGRKAISYSSMGRATTAARGVGRTIKETQDIGRAKETVAAMEQRLQQLETDFKAETDVLAARIDPLTETLDTISIKPTKTNISVQLVALCWLPYWQSSDGKIIPAF